LNVVDDYVFLLAKSFIRKEKKMITDLERTIERELKFEKFILDGIKRADRDLEKYNFDGCWMEKTGSKESVYFLRSRNKDGSKKSVKLGDDYDERVIAFKQKMYNQELKTTIEHNIRILESPNANLKRLRHYDFESIDARMKSSYVDKTGSVIRMPGVIPPSEWVKLPFDKSVPPISGAELKTPDGTRVRSKSEIIIYTILSMYDIPFRYEEDIKVQNEIGQIHTRNADFVIYCKDGTKIILEHFGYIRDARVLDNYIIKLKLYLKNGYVLNDTLFITSDGIDGSFNAQAIMDLVERIILPRVKGI